ncbi:protein translocase subunit SecD [bacterium]|nr:protein translocase subunit SecD [bacterium]|tara:strand:- start:658 stop:1920 length:1263 start_codon:yes stop_codon:yes gene_type:complete
MSLLIKRWIWIIGVISVFSIAPILKIADNKNPLSLGLDLSGGVDILIKVIPPPEENLDEIVPGVVDVMSKRLDPQGVLSISVQQVSEDRINIQVPSSSGESPERVRRLIEQSAHLELVDTGFVSYLAGSKACRNDGQSYENCDLVYTKDQVVIEGGDLKRATVSPNPNGGWQVDFELSESGSNAFARHTASHISQYLTIVLDANVVSSPIINSAIFGNGSISGSFSIEEANELALLLNAGRLDADIDILKLSSVGAALGKDSLEKSIKAAWIGLILVAIYMLGCYKRRGVAAVFSLVIFSSILFSLFSSLNITLTLPGIAGLILSIGMAVDANVIIFERIKEEERSGKSGLLALEEGFSNALSVITDANVTTFLIGLVLYALATGPVRGFAVTLLIGIMVSVFAALVVTRAIMETWENNE